MRIKRFTIPIEAIFRMLQQDDYPLLFSVTKGIPADAERRGIYYDFATDAFYLCVEHLSFDEVIEGDQIPDGGSVIAERHRCERSPSLPEPEENDPAGNSVP